MLPDWKVERLVGRYDRENDGARTRTSCMVMEKTKEKILKMSVSLAEQIGIERGPVCIYTVPFL